MSPSALSHHHQALGAALRSARVGAGLTQHALAARAGLSKRWLGAIERGQANPTYDTLLALADALGVKLHSLVDSAPDWRSRASP